MTAYPETLTKGASVYGAGVPSLAEVRYAFTRPEAIRLVQVAERVARAGGAEIAVPCSSMPEWLDGGGMACPTNLAPVASCLSITAEGRIHIRANHPATGAPFRSEAITDDSSLVKAFDILSTEMLEPDKQGHLEIETWVDTDDNAVNPPEAVRFTFTREKALQIAHHALFIERAGKNDDVTLECGTTPVWLSISKETGVLIPTDPQDDGLRISGTLNVSKHSVMLTATAHQAVDNKPLLMAHLCTPGDLRDAYDITMEDALDFSPAAVELREALENMVGVFDSPLARRRIDGEIAEEARQKARDVLARHGRRPGIVPEDASEPRPSARRLKR